MEGFLLGLGNGTSCIAYCYPVLLPYILSEEKKLSGQYGTLGLFLIGRLMGYIAVGAAAGALGSLLNPGGEIALIIGSTATILIALLLILRPLLNRRKPGNGCIRERVETARAKGFWFPLSLGLCTGLSICPPFLMGITRAFAAGSIGYGILFFLFFYLGTFVYFLPLPLAGLISKKINIRFIANATMVLMGIYYLYRGLIVLLPVILGGFK